MSNEANQEVVQEEVIETVEINPQPPEEAIEAVETKITGEILPEVQAFLTVPDGKKPSKAAITRAGILAGLGNIDVKNNIDAIYPGEGKVTCISWYRSSDPIITGKPRIVGKIKTNVVKIFSEYFSGASDEDKANITLGLAKEHVDLLIRKAGTDILIDLLPEDLKPKEEVKEPKAKEAKEVKEPKAKEVKEPKAKAKAKAKENGVDELAKELKA